MPRPVDPPPPGAPAGERIAKLLARAGVASRREVERMIADGRIARDGIALDTPATVLASLAGVTVDGQPVAAPEPTRLFLYHKPVGLLVAERDPKGRPTIYDRLPRDLPRLVPVGRLDMNTEGLLLLTTDGGFKRQLELPATGVQRTYRARTYGRVTQAQLEALIEGIEIDGMRYGSIDANMERRTGANFWIELTLTEGKNREVRRVLEHLGLEVSRLIRTRYGPFVLGDLPSGDIGEVRQADLTAFRQTLKGGGPIQPIAVGLRAGFRASPSAPRSGRGTTPSKTATPKPLPGERRGPVLPSTQRTSSGHLDLGARRGGTDQGQRPTSAPVRGGTPTATGSRKEGGDVITALTPRPAKLQRKTGWAKPKPKSGPTRPRKPRA